MDEPSRPTPDDAGTRHVDARRPPPPSGPTLTERLRAAPITFAILVVNLAWFLWAEKHGSTEKADTLLRFGAVEAIHVWGGEPWRVASYMVLHIGWLHLLWNSYAGFSICASVERALGPRRFVAAYLLSGVAGGCATVITFYPAPSAGASGAMFGMIGALLALRRRTLGSFHAFLADPATRSTLLNAGIWLLIGTQVNFNNRAHLGGLLGGAAITWVVTSPARRVLTPLFTFAFAVLLLVSLKPWWQPSGADRAALRAYGARYLFGLNDFAKDPARGERFARRACEAGDEAACHDLVLAGRDEGAVTRAAEVLKQGCDEGKPVACYGLGGAYEDGRGVPAEPSRSIAPYEKACAAGQANACVRLGYLKWQGKVTPRDSEAAAKLFERACAAGDDNGCAGKGAMLASGPDPGEQARGLGIMRAACAKGSAWACSMVKAAEDGGVAAGASVPVGAGASGAGDAGE